MHGSYWQNGMGREIEIICKVVGGLRYECLGLHLP